MFKAASVCKPRHSVCSALCERSAITPIVQRPAENFLVAKGMIVSATMMGMLLAMHASDSAHVSWHTRSPECRQVDLRTCEVDFCFDWRVAVWSTICPMIQLVIALRGRLNKLLVGALPYVGVEWYYFIHVPTHLISSVRMHHANKIAEHCTVCLYIQASELLRPILHAGCDRGNLNYRNRIDNIAQVRSGCLFRCNYYLTTLHNPPALELGILCDAALFHPVVHLRLVSCNKVASVVSTT